jgi:hypothetical protein
MFKLILRFFSLLRFAFERLRHHPGLTFLLYWVLCYRWGWYVTARFLPRLWIR